MLLYFAHDLSHATFFSSFGPNFNCLLLTHFTMVFLQILYIAPHICWLGAR